MKIASIIGMKNYSLAGIFAFVVQIPCFSGTTTLLTEQDFLTMWKQRGEKVAEGSFGNVYIVEFENKKYALKQIKDSENLDALQEDIQGNEMLLSGIKKINVNQSLYKNNIRNVTQYYGAFKTPENESVLVFEAAEGKSFETYLKSLSAKERYSKNTFHEISIVLAKYANLIHLEHEAGTINRDVKGQNFHLQKKDKDFSIKGLDHGTMLKLTAIDNGGQRTKAGIGTPNHMAPEILSRDVCAKGYSPAVDVFALGCELLNAYCNFFDKQFFALPWHIAEFLENKKAFQYLPNWEDFLDKALSQNKEKTKRIASCLEHLKVLSNDQQEFLGNLIKDCCAFNPTHRISARQVGFLLERFSTSFEENQEEIALKYEEIKEIALQKYPLSIPQAIMYMINAPETKVKGYVALNLLIHSNSSYKYTKEYQSLLDCEDVLDLNSKGQLLAYLALGNIDFFHILGSTLVDVVQSIKESIWLENFPVLEKNKTMPMPANIILNLGKADLDFRKQEVYGFALLQQGEEQDLQMWNKYNKGFVKSFVKRLEKESFLTDFPIFNEKKIIPLSAEMIINLGKINKSFQRQEIYGMALLQKGDNQILQDWAKKNKSTVKTLTKEAYISDDPNLDSKKKIPMSPQMILNLGKIDKNFTKQEVYGWALEKSKQYEDLKQWSSENPDNKLSKQQLQWH